MNEPKGTALITGASSGIGAIYADRLARQGYDLILVARSVDKLDRVARTLRAATGRDVVTLPADLSNPGELRLIEARLINDRRITMLVNNAGIGAPIPTWQADVDQMETMIDINATALTRLTYAVAQRFAAAGKGTIINIASTVAIAPEFLLNGVYGATKAFVVALTASLHAELSDKGVRVQVVLPGATATDFWDLSGVPLSGVPAEIVMSADAMVDAALAGLALGEIITIPALPDTAAWDAFDAARIAMLPNLSRVEPADRYRVAAVAA